MSTAVPARVPRAIRAQVFTVNQTLLAGFRSLIQRKLKWSIPIFWGRFGGPIPHPVQLTIAVGTPIRVPEPKEPGAEPSEELVAKLHAEYVAAIEALFEKHKAAAGYGDRQLEIVAAWGAASKKDKKAKKSD